MRGGPSLKGKGGLEGFRRSLKVQGRTGGFSKDPSLMGKSCANERNESSFQIAECSPLYQKKKENCRKIQFGQNLPTLPQTAKHIRLIIII